MATVTKGKTFTSTEQVTAAKLHQLVDSATVTAIVNADIDAAAGIVDTKLAQIATAGKVSGAALTSLASIPAGAGVIPAANLTSVAQKGANTDITSLSGLDGSMNPTNLITGGDFESWSAGTSAAPDGWTLEGADATIAREATIIKLGTYSAKVTRAGTNCYMEVNFDSSVAYWKGRTVTLGCWIYATVADRARICLADGTQNVFSSYHTGDSTWQWLTVTMTFSGSASLFRVRLAVDTGDTTAYFDGAMLVEGSSAFAFSPKPLEGSGGLAYIENDYTGHGLYIQQDGVLASDKYGLYVYSNAVQNTSPLAVFFQDNASSSKDVLNIQNDGTARCAYFNQAGVLGANNNGLFVYSDAANVAANSALVKITQDNAGSSEPALEIDNDGLGASIEIDADGSHASTKVIGVLIDVDNADTGDQIAIDVDQVDEAKSYFARFNATTAWTSTKEPETHAEAGWIKIMVGTTAYFIPYYAAS